MPGSTTPSLKASTESILTVAEDDGEIEMTNPDHAVEDAAETQITDQDVEAEEDIIFMDPQWFLAAANGHTHVLQECNIDFHNNLTPKRNTLLHVAAQFGQAESVTLILSRCPSLLQQPNEEGDTPLHLAAREGHLEVAKVLIPQAGDQERGNAAEMLGMKNKARNTALHEAVSNHHPLVVEFLISHDPRYEYAANGEGKTPLYIASEQGFGDLVNMIIDKCSSPAYSGTMGRTALHAAVYLNDPGMTKKILEWKPELTQELDKNGWSPLHIAAYVGGHPTIVRQLLEKSKPRVVYLGLRNYGNRTALHIAAGRGHVDIVKILVSQFPDCCEKLDSKGNNVLHLITPKNILVSSGVCNIRWLRVKGLMNQKNVKGETPLHLLQCSSSWPPVGTMLSFLTSIFSTLKWKWIRPSGRVVMAPQEIEEGSLEIKEDSNRSECKSKGSEEKISRIQKLPPLEIKEDNDSSEWKSKGSEEKIARMQKIMETHMVVAALIATVTFAAGFTLPGGYIQSGSEGGREGMAVLLFHNATNTKMQDEAEKAKKVFKNFLVADSIALVLSVCAIGVYFYASLSMRTEKIMQFHLFYGTLLTVAAMAAMVFAFVLGVEAVTDAGYVMDVFIAVFVGLLLVPWFLKAPSPLIFVKGPRAISWGRKQTMNFILFSILYGVGILFLYYFEEVDRDNFDIWSVGLGFPMLLFTFLLHDYL